jgi:hypothetical protein
VLKDTDSIDKDRDNGMMFEVKQSCIARRPTGKK